MGSSLRVTLGLVVFGLLGVKLCHLACWPGWSDSSLTQELHRSQRLADRQAQARARRVLQERIVNRLVGGQLPLRRALGELLALCERPPEPQPDDIERWPTPELRLGGYLVEAFARDPAFSSPDRVEALERLRRELEEMRQAGS